LHGDLLGVALSTLHLVIFGPEDYLKQGSDSNDMTAMTLPQLLARVKKVLLYEITPRKRRESLSEQGPNNSFTFSNLPSDEYRLRNDTYKVLRRDGSMFD
jgi:hypothetical protein